MRILTSIVGLLLSFGIAAGEGQQTSDAPVLRVGVFGYQPDGSSTLAAWDNPPSTNSVVSIRSLCAVTAGSSGPPASATDAWRFSTKVVAATPNEATVEVEWQRILEGGQVVTAPTGHVQLTLRVGDHVVLDRVTPDAPSECSIVGASFEARYSHARIGREGDGTEWRALLPPDKPRTGPLDVNLWLIHSAPGRPDRVLHQSLMATREGAAFAFSPVTVETPSGPMVVQVTGSFAVTVGPIDGERLTFAVNRRISSTRSNAPVRDVGPENQGGSRTTTAMPRPDDVLSFELPPVRLKGQAALPDQFSVRMRIVPR
jgi:hypothetical protein